VLCGFAKTTGVGCGSGGAATVAKTRYFKKYTPNAKATTLNSTVSDPRNVFMQLIRPDSGGETQGTTIPSDYTVLPINQRSFEIRP
jgi:hypothetical protein